VHLRWNLAEGFELSTGVKGPLRFISVTRLPAPLGVGPVPRYRRGSATDGVPERPLPAEERPFPRKVPVCVHPEGSSWVVWETVPTPGPQVGHLRPTECDRGPLPAEGHGSSTLELARKAHRGGQDATAGGSDRATQSAGGSERAYGSEIETRVALFPPVARLIEALAWPLEVPWETSETAVNWTTVKIV
jgi:hypothetical protein